ncbi:hypothetical protein CDAR_104481 [Caerostris darwini]|uniref:Uncharacterized protein n=1 Tax=Caerostris darwini TaxID=1538125 RepID=A0AAV4PTC4_9ARAC|nr:hypothetical protein CDAR_104481 [Caerostris darwini]
MVLFYYPMVTNRRPWRHRLVNRRLSYNSSCQDSVRLPHYRYAPFLRTREREFTRVAEIYSLSSAEFSLLKTTHCCDTYSWGRVPLNFVANWRSARNCFSILTTHSWDPQIPIEYNLPFYRQANLPTDRIIPKLLGRHGTSNPLQSVPISDTRQHEGWTVESMPEKSFHKNAA